MPDVKTVTPRRRAAKSEPSFERRVRIRIKEFKAAKRAWNRVTKMDDSTDDQVNEATAASCDAYRRVVQLLIAAQYSAAIVDGVVYVVGRFDENASDVCDSIEFAASQILNLDGMMEGGVR